MDAFHPHQDSQNRLVSCVYGGTTSTFKYGADGLRRQATVNGVTTDYVYDGSTLIREGQASGGTLTTVTATYSPAPVAPNTAATTRRSRWTARAARSTSAAGTSTIAWAASRAK